MLPSPFPPCKVNDKILDLFLKFRKELNSLFATHPFQGLFNLVEDNFNSVSILPDDVDFRNSFCLSFSLKLWMPLNCSENAFQKEKKNRNSQHQVSFHGRLSNNRPRRAFLKSPETFRAHLGHYNSQCIL